MENKFITTRKKTLTICGSLETEDLVVQPIPEVSPPKWHLGHTTWFLEELLLNKYQSHYSFYNQKFQKIFNSYYKGLGEHWPQGRRGILSRPTVKEVIHYREAIDEQILNLIEKNKDNQSFLNILELAINHEEQHQELLLMDIKNILWVNPTLPSYQDFKRQLSPQSGPSWIHIAEGVYQVGAGKNSFHFDNEAPEHNVYLNAFSLSDHLVTNGDYLNFMNANGYSEPKFWLSMGWDFIKSQNITSPLYWIRDSKMNWNEFTLYGSAPLDMNAPVAHISYFEAAAFAQWNEMRLPREEEFELAESIYKSSTINSFSLHPENNETFSSQLWCWTQSHYSPYPGFKPFPGKLEEYNAKFMCNQFVLKGGCVITPPGHNRKTYRNFYEPHQRWMFSGICLAKDRP